MYLFELIGLVQNNQQFVVHARERMEQYRERLSRRSRLIRIEEQHDDICPIGHPFYDALEIIPAIHQGAISARWHPSGRNGTVDHAWAVHQHEGFVVDPTPHLELSVVNESRPELPQRRKAHVGVTHQRRSVLIDVGGTRCDNRKAIIGRGNTCSLHLAAHDVVDKG